MKIYRKYVRTSQYLNEDSNDILFDDGICIDVELNFDESIFSSDNINQVKFPGKEQFRQDVINILENEYGFEVIEDVYDGIKQKGHFSNRQDSLSLYIDTYFNLSNISNIIDCGQLSEEVMKARIYCFIHFRFSDHILYDVGDSDHNKYLNDNARKFTHDRPDVTHVIKEETVELNERNMMLYYNEAIEDMKDQLENRMRYWIRKADRYFRLNK